MHTHFRRAAVAALACVLTFSAIGLTPAQARHRSYGNAAALAAVAAVFGTVAVLAARDQYRDDYYGGPYDGGYGYPGPYAYGPVYRHHWHHWHR